MNLPALPREIFNRDLYRSVLRLWFAGQPASATGPAPPTMKRWFNVGTTSEERKNFDSDCSKITRPALDFLGPERYQLPKFESFDVDRQQSLSLSQGLRTRIFEDGKASPSAAELDDDADGIPKGEMDHSDIARAFFILLDQMPRNIFRDVSEQWLVYAHYDRLSRALMHSILGTSSSAADPVFNLDQRDRYFNNPSRRLWWYMPLEHSEDLRDHDLFAAKTLEMQDACDQEAGKKFAENTKSFEKEHRDILEKYGRYCHRNAALGRESRLDEKAFLEGGGSTFGTS